VVALRDGGIFQRKGVLEGRRSFRLLPSDRVNAYLGKLVPMRKKVVIKRTRWSMASCHHAIFSPICMYSYHAAICHVVTQLRMGQTNLIWDIQPQNCELKNLLYMFQF
jgi:hypothetical protein